MYWSYGTVHGLCGAHLLRDLAGVAEHPRHTRWASCAAGVLRDACHATNEARRDGHDRLDPDVLAGIETRWIAALRDALATVGEDPPKGPERIATNLAAALYDTTSDVLRFARDLRVWSVAASHGVSVACVTGLQMRRAAVFYAGSAKTDPIDAGCLLISRVETLTGTSDSTSPTMSWLKCGFWTAAISISQSTPPPSSNGVVTPSPRFRPRWSGLPARNSATPESATC